MRRLAERHTVQRVGAGARGQRADHGVRQRPYGAVKGWRALDALGDVHGAGQREAPARALVRDLLRAMAAREQSGEGSAHVLFVPDGNGRLPPEIAVAGCGPRGAALAGGLMPGQVPGIRGARRRR